MPLVFFANHPLWGNPKARVLRPRDAQSWLCFFSSRRSPETRPSSEPRDPRLSRNNALAFPFSPVRREVNHRSLRLRSRRHEPIRTHPSRCPAAGRIAAGIGNERNIDLAEAMHMAAGSNTTGSPQQRATASYSKNKSLERGLGVNIVCSYGFREQDLIQYHSHCVGSCFSDLSRFLPSAYSKNAICLASITRGSTLKSATKRQGTDGTTAIWLWRSLWAC